MRWGLVVSSSGVSSPGLIVRGASCPVTVPYIFLQTEKFILMQLII